jgi:large subunit ribosomal protein L17
MRHLKKRNKITKTKNQRKAIYHLMVSSLILKERIITTEAKAKKIRPFLEKNISRAKQNTLANKRFLLQYFPPKTVDKLFKELGVRYKERAGGYSRIIKTDPRKNDSAKMVIIELVK